MVFVAEDAGHGITFPALLVSLFLLGAGPALGLSRGLHGEGIAYMGRLYLKFEYETAICFQRSRSSFFMSLVSSEAVSLA